MPYETRNCRFIEPASQPRLASILPGGDGEGDWLWMRCRSLTRWTAPLVGYTVTLVLIYIYRELRWRVAAMIHSQCTSYLADSLYYCTANATWNVCKDVTEALDARWRHGTECARIVCTQRKIVLVQTNSV